jgi:hypothetical protein
LYKFPPFSSFAFLIIPLEPLKDGVLSGRWDGIYRMSLTAPEPGFRVLDGTGVDEKAS